MRRPSNDAARNGPEQLTGNHYLAIPQIDPRNGAIRRVNVVHRGLLGLLEWVAGLEPEAAGDALFAPHVRVDGVRVVLAGLAWEELERWIPHFRMDLRDDLRLSGTICSPADAGLSARGALYVLEVEHRGSRGGEAGSSAVPREIEIALEGTWRWSLRTVATPRALWGENRLLRSAQPAGMVLEAGGAAGAAALAVVADEAARYTAGEDDAPLEELGAGDDLVSPNGTPLRFRVAHSIRLPVGGRATVAFYVGVAPERDGALATATALRRSGARELVRRTRLELARLARQLPEPALSGLLNRNLLFNYFYAVGRAVDDDRLYPTASRSPRCPGSAVVRERDALYWTLPAVTLADPLLARELLLRVFEQYGHRPGEAARYLDGGVLGPGYALDQHCAYILALDRYVRETGDASVLDVAVVQDVLREVDAALFHRLHPEVLLGATELLPSGEPPRYPYVTYDNVLIWAVAQALERVWIAEDDRDRAHFAGAADDIAATIWRYAIAEVEGLSVLAGSTDLQGEAAVYDDPAGSLMLLPYLGFCEMDDPIWRNTVALLHSPSCAFWLGNRPFPGMASRGHPGTASILALCADLLSDRRDEALDVLRRLDLDGGVAGEGYDPETGRVTSAPHFAAAAGFLAWTLHHALGT